MCGRSSITKEESELERAFKATFYTDKVERWIPLYNIAPTHSIPTIIAEDRGHFNMAHWGFKRRWKNFKTGNTSDKILFNAKGETVHELKSFKKAFESGQRCVFIMDGFYEWMNTSIGKIPFRIGLKDNSAFAVAGIYEKIEMDGHETLCANLITTAPNPMMKLIHNKPGKERMPAILTMDEMEEWLNPDLRPTESLQLIQTYPADAMKAYSVSNELNKSYENDMELADLVHYDMDENEALIEASNKIGYELFT